MEIKKKASFFALASETCFFKCKEQVPYKFENKKQTISGAILFDMAFDFCEILLAYTFNQSCGSKIIFFSDPDPDSDCL